MQANLELITLANEAWVSRCLHAAVILGLPNMVTSEPVSVEELSAKSKIEETFLEAILAVLSRRGIFKLENGSIAHSEKSYLLLEEHDSGLSNIVKWIGSDEHWNAFGCLPEAAVKGLSGFEVAHGKSFFEYLSQNQNTFEIFNRSMGTFTAVEARNVANAMDFSPFRTILDLGGGTGVLAQEISDRYRNAEVTLFDLPEVLASPDVKYSGAKVAGDFFSDLIPKADLTILMNVLHDWPDQEAERIITAVRNANGSAGKLCIVEGLPSNNSAKVEMVNLGMAVMTGGRQRSRDEYDALLGRSGYRIVSETDCSQYVSILIAE
jgi:hypothetical protein